MAAGPGSPCWKDDREVTACEACFQSFTVILRRHHCRFCGGVFCGTCAPVRTSSIALPLPRALRVCDSCAVNGRNSLACAMQLLVFHEEMARRNFLALCSLELEALVSRVSLLLEEFRFFRKVERYECNHRQLMEFYTVGVHLSRPDSADSVTHLLDRPDSPPLRRQRSQSIPIPSRSSSRAPACGSLPLGLEAPLGLWSTQSDAASSFVSNVSESPSSADEDETPNAYGFLGGRGSCCLSEVTADPEEVAEVIRNWPCRDTAALRKLILAGIPNFQRADLWWTCSGVESTRAKHPPALYADLLSAPTDQSSQSALEYEASIRMDLKRTLIDHSLFANGEDPPVETALQNVLLAFARLHPEVGYCQGMSFIAATLLLHLREEQAFWLFLHMFEEFGLQKLYDARFVGLTALVDSVAQCLPRNLHSHFEEERITPSTYLTGWLLTLFTGPFQCWTAIMTIWDLLLVTERSPVFLLRLAVTLHNAFLEPLLQAHDVISLMTFLQREIPERFHQPQLRRSLHPRVLNQPLPPSLPFFGVDALLEKRRQANGERSAEGEPSLLGPPNPVRRPARLSFTIFGQRPAVSRPESPPQKPRRTGTRHLTAGGAGHVGVLMLL
eukprot:TRINITY_DN6517_c0_g1_i1.p2 TRINITY_DN6517_c0_g1~~TRINITY_DN6517_c0_g1_i1.p2  ORF type:complete len:614 (+),score=70.58 TRINITY_DN6517_c0_g1_i1:56-1897(+)